MCIQYTDGFEALLRVIEGFEDCMYGIYLYQLIILISVFWIDVIAI